MLIKENCKYYLIFLKTWWETYEPTNAVIERELTENCAMLWTLIMKNCGLDFVSAWVKVKLNPASRDFPK